MRNLAGARRQFHASTSVHSNFQIVHHGFGSMLKVQVQPGEALACRNKSIIGLSGSVKVANKTAVWQRLAGHNFITQNIAVPAEGQPAEVLISPPVTGQLALIDLNPSDIFHISADSWVASSATTELEVQLARQGLGFAINGSFWTMKAKGQGSLVVHAPYSSLFRMALAKNEEYLVHPRLLVAWKSDQKPVPVYYDVDANATIDKNTSLVSFIRHWSINRLRYASISAARWVKTWFLGDQTALYRITGPGEFYIASTPAPRLGGLISAFAYAKYQGDALRDAWRLKPQAANLGFPSFDTQLETQRPVAISTVTVSEEGTVNFGREKSVSDGEQQQQPNGPSVIDSTKEVPKSKWRSFMFG